jgi:hypothetical protein
MRWHIEGAMQMLALRIPFASLPLVGARQAVLPPNKT